MIIEDVIWFLIGRYTKLKLKFILPILLTMATVLAIIIT